MQYEITFRATERCCDEDEPTQVLFLDTETDNVLAALAVLVHIATQMELLESA